MPQFTWTGRDARQCTRTGIIEARSARQAADALSAMALVPDVILPFPPPARAPAGVRAGRAPARACAADLQRMASEARALLRSGVAKDRVFTALSSSTARPDLADALQRMGSRVRDGMPMWRAMGEHPAFFDDFSLAVMRQAEADGQPAEGFRCIAQHLEFSCALRARAGDAASRTVELVVSLVAAAALGLLGAVPAAQSTYLAGLTDLPGPTRALLAAADRLGAAAVWMLAAAAGLLLLSLLARRWPGPFAGWLRGWDRLRLREPLAGPTLRLSATAQLAACLALGQRAGLPLQQNLELAARQFDNRQLRTSVAVLHRLVGEGASLSDACAVERWLGPHAQRWLQEGESRGTLAESLADVTRHYRELAEQSSVRLQWRYRTAMVVGIGTIALAVVLGLLLPLLG